MNASDDSTRKGKENAGTGWGRAREIKVPNYVDATKAELCNNNENVDKFATNRPHRQQSLKNELVKNGVGDTE